MASNFDFLTGPWAIFAEDAHQTEQHAYTAPRTCAFYARRTLERVAKWLYAHDSSLQEPYQDNLAALIHEETFQKLVGRSLFHQVRLIQKVGNQAVHSDVKLRQLEGLQLTKAVHNLLSWVVRVYTATTGSPVQVPPFKDNLLLQPPNQAQEQDKTAAELDTLQNRLKSKDEAFEAAQQRLASSQEEIDRLRAEIARIRAENEAALPAPDFTETEAQTRDLFIDVLLREAGWDPAAPDVREFEVQGMPTPKGQGFVDYVLWGKDGQPLAVVEAKRTRRSPLDGQRQAELYANCLEQMTGQRPVIYYTNGYETWLWDNTYYPAREVQGFATRDELQLMINRRTSRRDINKTAINRDIADRYYQEEAIRRVMERFQDTRARAALLVMATGTGKTRVSAAAVDVLMRSNWVRRVLFLADRTALVRQAKGAFAAHLPNLSLVNLVSEKESDEARVFFCTYHTMMGLIDEEQPDGKRRFGSNAFDLIIIDEAHRSIYQKFGAIFAYFDALLLGLTATPRDEVDRNTYHLFDLEKGVPTYAYELEQAVADQYLVPPKAISVPTKFHRQGIKYADLSDEEKAEYEATFLDEETGRLPREIDAAALNQWLFNANTVDQVLAHLMANGQKIEGGDRLGKTIIFAKNHDHAEFIAERFDKSYPHLAGRCCRVIDNRISYAQSLIDDFTLLSKQPTIAVSVDMLDTGIDVPEVVNLVFFKRVRSKTKFWQMLGRGTRLCLELFGPGMHKQFFTVFDYCENLEFFSANPQGAGDVPLQEGVKQKIFKRRLELAARLQEQDLDDTGQALHGALLDQMHEAVTRMNPDNFLVRPHRMYVEVFADREQWAELSKSDQLDITQHLANLPYPDDAEDEEFARRFDLLILNLQLAILDKSTRLAQYQMKVRELAAGLEERRNIPLVAEQMELIQEIQSDDYWQGITLPMLEQLRRRLRVLIKFVDRSGPRQVVYTDFEDELGEVTEIEGLVQADPALQNYRVKVEQFIRSHEDHLTIRRLKQNQPITTKDLEGLEAVLFAEAGGSKQDFQENFGEQPLGELVRRIVGLDRNAMKEAFGEFLGSGTLNSTQIRFIDLIIEHLVKNGVMNVEALFEPPFTDIHYESIDGVLPDQADAVISVVQRVNRNAWVA